MLEFQLDDALEIMALQEKRHFSPHYVCTVTGIADLKAVTEYMLSVVNKKLRVYYEVECPEGDSDFAVKSPLDIKYELRKCHICGTPYTPDPNKIWIAFDFLPQYIEHVKKRTKN